MPAIPFRLRAHEVSRLEAFTDVVFGFALTLIVVSLEVPKSYGELIHALADFPAFAICFAILLWIWHAHYTFFRRYGIQDEFTIWMNSLLLFVVLFYVYPLKFVFANGRHPIEAGQARVLFLIYGAGFAGVFLIYALMYWHAGQLHDTLDLNAVEQHDTRTHVIMFGANVATGVVSMILALTLPGRLVGVAGYFYFTTGVSSAVIGTWRGRARRLVEQAMSAA